MSEQNPVAIGRAKHEELMVLFDKVLAENEAKVAEILENVAKIDLIDYVDSDNA